MGQKLLGALSAIALLAVGCSSKNPVAPNPPPATSGSTFTVSITATPSTLTTGATSPATIAVAVRRRDNGQPPLDGSTCAITTSLGSFGTDGSGKPITTETLKLLGGNATTSLFAGSTAGTAQILAQVDTSQGQTTVPIQQPGPPPPFYLTSIQPNFGPASGGQQVKITGAGITAPVRVLIGGVVAKVSAVTSTQITAVTPRSKTPLDAGSTLSVDVMVTNAIDQTSPVSDTLAGGYTYSGADVPTPPAVFAVSPDSGPNDGGTLVTILGQGFVPPVQVLFGTGTSSQFNGLAATVVSATDTTIQARTPAATGLGVNLANQQVDVLVRNTSTGTTALGTGVFRYTGAPFFINSLTPRQGPYTGGTTVTIGGSGFSGSLQVQLGGVVQNLTGETSTTLTVQTVPVTVTNCNPPSGPVTVTQLTTGESVTSPLTFTYTVPKPVVTSLSPTSGPQAGGNTLTIHGSSFESNVRVEIGGVAATVGSVSSDGTQIAVTVPAFTGTFSTTTCTDSSGNSGKMNVGKAVDVTVTGLSTGCSDTFPQSYTYEPSDTSCQVTPTAPTADFSYTASGALVTFTASATGTGNTYSWSFGDGGSASTASTTITHDYSAAVTAGESQTFTVMLTVKNSAGSAMATKSVTVTRPP
jgi:PKD repeat protein